MYNELSWKKVQTLYDLTKPGSCSLLMISLMIFCQYTWLFGWFGNTRERDLKINVICPATDVHVRKVLKFIFIV